MPSPRRRLEHDRFAQFCREGDVERAADDRRRLAAQRNAAFVEVESPDGDRMNVQPADAALWRSRGWRVVPFHCNP